ncbi:MAG: right-handed parallel beta-helix repeat-containing protein [Acidobacteria bacterium]|nr:right-handed parallel beta-helix repeat-containing protein [Acidobacteriota bacterium]
METVSDQPVVLEVTTLASSGPGSLRAALTDPRPRLVVFEVGGVIDLEGKPISVKTPHLTLAGQTAPDPGITVIRGGVSVQTHDVLIQHIAVRPGDGGPAPSAPDALGVVNGYDVVFENCSATWAVDENLSVSGPADVEGEGKTSHDVTLRRCLIAEGLSKATHPKGEHSKGTLVHDGVRNVTIEGCLYAHNRERNPRLKGGSSATVIDSVMYDWGSACVGVGARGNAKMLTPATAVLAGNVAIAGPDTKTKVFVKSVDPGGRVFLRDNLAFDVDGTPLPLTDKNVTLLPSPPTPLRNSRPLEAMARVLRTAGSRPARRDPIDARIVQSVIEGTGGLVDTQGAYPVRVATRRVLSVPSGPLARQRFLDAFSAQLSTADLDVSALNARLARGD